MSAGVTAEEDKDYGQAEKMYRLSMSSAERLLPQFGRLSSSVDSLIKLYMKELRYGDAEPLFKRSLSISQQVYGPSHERTAKVLDRYTDLLRKSGRNTEAGQMETQARNIRVKLDDQHALLEENW